MRVGIIGTGRMAKARAEVLRDEAGVELTWICSRSFARAEEFLKTVKCEGVQVYEDLDTAFELGKAEAVVITGPNSLHVDAAIAAFGQGLDVFLEYPAAVSAQEGQSLIDAVQNASFMVGLTHRFGGQLAATKNLPGRLGAPVMYQCAYCSGNPISRWYDDDALSGGMFVSSLYHYIDEATALFGGAKVVGSSYAATRDSAGFIQQDCAAVQLKFSDGPIAHISYARGMKPPGIGSRRVIIYENGYVVDDDRGARVLSGEDEKPLQYQDVDAVAAETRYFLKSVAGRSVIDSTVYQAQESLKLAVEAAVMAG